ISSPVSGRNENAGSACASDRLIGLASLATRPTRPSSAFSTVSCTASCLRPSVAYSSRVPSTRKTQTEHTPPPHVVGDQHHHFVEAFLRADRLRHHFAKPA